MNGRNDDDDRKRNPANGWTFNGTNIKIFSDAISVCGMHIAHISLWCDIVCIPFGYFMAMLATTVDTTTTTTVTIITNAITVANNNAGATTTIYRKTFWKWRKRLPLPHQPASQLNHAMTFALPNHFNFRYLYLFHFGFLPQSEHTKAKN